MRYLLLFSAFFFKHFVVAQEPLFLFASFSDGVKIDNRTPKIGEVIDETSKQFFIPKGGYALVIVREGYAYQLTNSISVDTVSKKVNRVFRQNKIRATGTVMGTSIFEVELIGAPQNQFADIFGDSILIAIKSNYNRVKPPFKIEFKDVFEQVLFSDSTLSNWKIVRVKDLLILSKDALLFQVGGNGFRSMQHLIKPISDRRREILRWELSKVNNSGASKILSLAILELNNLYYDHTFLLYQLEKVKYRPENVILEAYIKNLKEKYQFKLFDFHK